MSPPARPLWLGISCNGGVCTLRREDGDVLRKALGFEVESQWKKWMPNGRHEKSRLRGKCEDWLDKVRCTLANNVMCWCKSDCCWFEGNMATLTCWDTAGF